MIGIYGKNNINGTQNRNSGKICLLNRTQYALILHISLGWPSEFTLAFSPSPTFLLSPPLPNSIPLKIINESHAESFLFTFWFWFPLELKITFLYTIFNFYFFMIFIIITIKKKKPKIVSLTHTHIQWNGFTFWQTFTLVFLSTKTYLM